MDNQQQATKRDWYKTPWGILLIFVLWPIFLSYWIWKRDWSGKIKIGLIAIIWFIFLSTIFANGLYQAGYNTAKKEVSYQNQNPTATSSYISPTPTATSSPTSILVPTLLPSFIPDYQIPSLEASQNSPIPSATPFPIISTSNPLPKREINKGSNDKSIKFYDTIASYYQMGLLNGEPYTEYESDYVVDINIEKQVVQLGLKYNSIIKSVDNQDKETIMKDFLTVKKLAESDRSLIIPEYRTLRWLVLTYHDINGIARGELHQMMIDDKPQWSEW